LQNKVVFKKDLPITRRLRQPHPLQAHTEFAYKRIQVYQHQDNKIQANTHRTFLSARMEVLCRSRKDDSSTEGQMQTPLQARWEQALLPFVQAGVGSQEQL